MLSPGHILRLVDSGSARILIERILANGRCGGPELKSLLQDESIRQPVALSLGLQRICELAYSAVAEGGELASRLIALQCSDGTFAGECPTRSAWTPSSRILASDAIALRALIGWSDVGSHATDHQRLLNESIERGLIAMQSALAHIESVDRIALSVVLWQLGDCERASKHLPMHHAHQVLARSDSAFLQRDLPRLALTMAA